ncbi:hypothetical protein [Paenibacillus crassostreae]|uniref:hypothetical protein n=1 Tax=Paenibacillus crassostreae TaxID=1763538 RepID=UPI0012FD9FE4|nr:hypothetical protein [Paenibacillus crassostreae]
MFIIAFDNDASEAIGLSFAVMAFMVSLSLSFYLFTTTGETIQKSYQMNSNTDNNIHSTLKDPIVYSVSGAEVRQSLYQIREIGVDIEVNGILYSKSLDPTVLNVSSINLNQYFTPTYIRDSTGLLTLLQFN